VLTIRPDYPGISGAVNASAQPQTQIAPNTAALAVPSSMAKGNK
jgi:hypothetical protein